MKCKLLLFIFFTFNICLFFSLFTHNVGGRMWVSTSPLRQPITKMRCVRQVLLTVCFFWHKVQIQSDFCVFFQLNKFLRITPAFWAFTVKFYHNLLLNALRLLVLHCSFPPLTACCSFIVGLWHEGGGLEVWFFLAIFGHFCFRFSFVFGGGWSCGGGSWNGGFRLKTLCFPSESHNKVCGTTPLELCPPSGIHGNLIPNSTKGWQRSCPHGLHQHRWCVNHISSAPSSVFFWIDRAECKLFVGQHTCLKTLWRRVFLSQFNRFMV